MTRRVTSDNYLSPPSRHGWLHPALSNLSSSIDWASFHRFSPIPILRVKLLPFTLSIPPGSTSSFIVLSWADHNSKNSKPNGSASLFGRRRRLPLEPTYPANQMARPRTRRNSPPAGKDELVEEAPSEGNGTPTSTPAASRAPTPALAPASAPGPPGKYTDEDLQRASKLALESFVQGQEHRQLQANSTLCDRPPKAKNPDFYYGHSHIECYYFCRQCEDHFDTAGATGPKRVPFAASFLRDRVNFWWQQHKTLKEQNRADPLTWDKFKAFLWQSLGESTAFVNDIWSRIKRDSQYQQEELQDWASHLIYFKSVLREFDIRCATTKEVLYRYFYKGLRPSIWLWIDEEGR